MPNTTEFELPSQVLRQIPDDLDTSTTSNQLTLETTVRHLAIHLDQLLSKFDPLTLFLELGIRVSYGLPPATDVSSRIDHIVQKRPPRYGLPADALGIAARFALERAILSAKFGDQKPSDSDIADIITTTATYMEIDAYRELAALPVTTDKPAMGRVTAHKSASKLSITYEEQDFDLFEYRRMLEWRFSDSDPKDLEAINEFKSGIPRDLQGVSDAMQTDLGFNAEDLITAIGTGIQFNWNMDYQALALDIAGFSEGLSQQILTAIDFLTFSTTHLRLQDLRPSATRHQKRRIVTHPFLVHSNCIILVRDLLFEALQRWVRYLQNGDWPVPVSAREKWPNLKNAIEELRNSRGINSFEPFVEAEIEKTGLPWGATSGANKKIGNVNITGEIDAIVINSARRTLWVVEAKDVTSDQNVLSLQKELSQMVNKYGPQVTRSVTEIEKNPVDIVHHVVTTWARRPDIHNTESVAVNDSELVQDWTVRPLIVVRDRSAAECLIEKPWDVVPVSKLGQKLQEG